MSATQWHPLIWNRTQNSSSCLSSSLGNDVVMYHSTIIFSSHLFRTQLSRSESISRSSSYCVSSSLQLRLVHCVSDFSCLKPPGEWCPWEIHWAPWKWSLLSYALPYTLICRPHFHRCHSVSVLLRGWSKCKWSLDFWSNVQLSVFKVKSNSAQAIRCHGVMIRLDVMFQWETVVGFVWNVQQFSEVLH
jgi:hypothetical protein